MLLQPGRTWSASPDHITGFGRLLYSQKENKGRKKEGRERKGSLRAGNGRKDTEAEGKAGVEK